MKIKIIYGAAIAILCISAIIIGIVSAANKPTNTPAEEIPPVEQTPPDDSNETPPGTDDGADETPEEPKPLAFVAPLCGTVVKEHSLDMPVFSTTLNEWRVHAGIDISTDDGAPVYASEDGVVSRLYNDPRYGYTVELTHSDDIVTRYSNLLKDDSVTLRVGDKVSSGDRIGSVGDSSIAELAEEPHLHFEILLRGVKVNPLDYITEESKKASLGIG